MYSVLANRKTLPGKIRGYDEPYPTYPEGHDRAFNCDLPTPEKAERREAKLSKGRALP